MASPTVAQSSAMDMTKKRRSSRDRRFHHGTCWISMSILEHDDESAEENTRKKITFCASYPHS